MLPRSAKNIQNTGWNPHCHIYISTRVGNQMGDRDPVGSPVDVNVRIWNQGLGLWSTCEAKVMIARCCFAKQGGMREAYKMKARHNLHATICFVV